MKIPRINGILCRHVTYLEDIALGNSFPGLLVLQHLFQNLCLLLHLNNLLSSLCAIVGLMSVVKSGHDLHKSVSLLQIGGSSPPNQFLKLGRLRLFLFLLHLIGGTKVLNTVSLARVQHRGITYIARVQDRGVFPADFWEHVALVEQQTVHIPNEPQVLLIPRCLTDGLPPLLNRLQDAVLHPGGPHGRPLGEPAHQFIQELLCTNLEMEGVSAVLDGNVEELGIVLSVSPASVIRAPHVPPAPTTQHFGSGS